MDQSCLWNLFKVFGRVRDIHLSAASETRKIGFAFVRFGTLEEVRRVTEKMNGMRVYGWGNVIAKDGSYQNGSMLSHTEMLKFHPLKKSERKGVRNVLNEEPKEEGRDPFDPIVLSLTGFMVADRHCLGKSVVGVLNKFCNVEKSYDESRRWCHFRGIALDYWNDMFFQRIGNHFGDLMLIEEDTLQRRRLNKASLLILTSNGKMISNGIKVIDGSRKFSVSMEVDSNPVDYKGIIELLCLNHDGRLSEIEKIPKHDEEQRQYQLEEGQFVHFGKSRGETSNSRKALHNSNGSRLQAPIRRAEEETYGSEVQTLDQLEENPLRSLNFDAYNNDPMMDHTKELSPILFPEPNPSDGEEHDKELDKSDDAMMSDEVVNRDVGGIKDRDPVSKAVNRNGRRGNYERKHGMSPRSSKNGNKGVINQVEWNLDEEIPKVVEKGNLRTNDEMEDEISRVIETAKEIIHKWRGENEGDLVVKLDFEKAYDSVDHGFLNAMMDSMVFGLRWRCWIKECISSPKVFVLVNGSPTPQFGMEKGLRQGDPLSPFLFNIASKGLNCLLHKAVNLDLMCGERIGNGEVHISYLQFVDDTILFIKPKTDYLCNAKRILRCFQLVSGLKINFHKSCVVRVGKNSGGRLVLIKFVMASIPTYFLSIFKIPAGVANKVEKLQRGFLWGDGRNRRKIHFVKWADVCKNKANGGLGIGRILDKNKGMLAKLLKAVFPRVYPLVNKKSGSILKFGSWIDSKWVWDVQTGRFLFDWEKDQWCSFQAILSHISIRKHISDALEYALEWKFNSNGVFSMGSFLKGLEKMMDGQGCFQQVLWKGMCPSKMEVFIWQLYKGLCPSRKSERVWLSLLSAAVWIVWEFRKNKIFDNKDPILALAADLIGVRIVWWFKAFGKKVLESVSDLLLIVKKRCVELSRVMKSMIKDWIPSMVGAFKFNVDVSARGNPGQADIGGVLRDSYGNVLCLFSLSIGITDSTSAELLAIEKAVELCLSEPSLRGRVISIVSDSIVATSWIKNGIFGSLDHVNTIYSVRSHLDSWEGLDVVFDSRMFNSFADNLAKLGFSYSDDFIYWMF
ncbi:hypothetical protein Ddye_030263 [Dipteronia dyeriana]|uniref:Reverse transcriptase domain-containing protein n=1 Tax=Dipteronia dyeriana TaxID=168575 RepID=A0AAD9TGE2_9ROSI|nr:hypothetical protein Ddye_030263 [Dipteronia dyeriana]